MDYNKDMKQGYQQPQQAATPPQPNAGIPAGARRVLDTEFNQGIQNVLLSRIEEQGQKNPNYGMAIDNGITREAAMELKLILPELEPIFVAMGLYDGAGQGDIQTPKPSSYGKPDTSGQNPLVNDNPLGASRGLMG